MADIIRMRAPGNLHERKDVPAVDHGKRLRSLIDLRALSSPDGRILRAIEVFQPQRDFRGGVFLRGIGTFEKNKTLVYE